MKLMKKFFAFLLVLVAAFTLVACDDARVDDILNTNAELQAKLDELAASNTALQGQVDELKQQLEESNKAYDSFKDNYDSFKDSFVSLLKELTVANEIQPEKELVLGNNFGELDKDGYYTVNAGDSAALDLKVVYTYAGIDFTLSDKEDYSIDYYWENTEDYNNGIGIDGKKLDFKLIGTYVVSISESYSGLDLELKFNILPAVNLLSSSDAKKVEIMVSASDQLKVVAEDGTVYTMSELSSSDPAVATVSATGLVIAVKEGSCTVYATAKAEGKDDRKLSIAVKVLPKRDANLLAGGADGATFNFKYASLDTKTKILAYMERYLINCGASIPAFNNSGLTLYSERVNFLTDTYVSLMGYGPAYKAPDTGCGAGTAADPAYRAYVSGDPTTLNHLNYADSIESDFLDLTQGALVNIDWKLDENGKGIGWHLVPSMAQTLPYPVEKVENNWQKVAGANGVDTYKSWKFDLRHDLKWANGEAINADDFIFTFQQILNSTFAFRRANLFYGGSAPIENAKEYYDGKEGVTWDNVGIKKVDDYSFVVTFKNALNEWDVCYNWSGFMQSPVYKPLWESCVSEDGKSTTYGTSMDKYMACGEYKLSYWEKGKEYRFTRNENYFAFNGENVEVLTHAYKNITYSVVKDANAALVLFEEGKLDVTAVPASAYEKYKANPGVKVVPGPTSFRYSVNKATQAQLDAEYGKGSWNAKPILQEDDFNWALYFGLDRKGLQAITKTSTGFDMYFTNVYSIVASELDGVKTTTYRDSEWANKVYSGLFENDVPLTPNDPNLNFNKALATNFYVSAVDSMIKKGVIAEGTEDNPTRITIEIAGFDGQTHEAVLAFMAQTYNELFNNTTKYGKKIVFEAVAAPQPGMDVYYAKQMTGQFDLAIAGISGGTLDPVGFMEVFCDDNRSGLFLNPGLDSHNANILIDLDLDGDGVLDGAKYWSFDALYSASNGDTFVKNGVEAVKPE